MRLAVVALAALVALLGVLLVGVLLELRDHNAELRACQAREGEAALAQARALVSDMQERAAAASSAR